MKILLLTPPMEKGPGYFLRVYPPLGLASLASTLLEAGHEVMILDTVAEACRQGIEQNLDEFVVGLSEQEITQAVSLFGPRIVGVTTLSAADAAKSMKVCELAKKADPAITTILGGPFPYLAPHRALADPHVDYICIGEGEDQLREFADFLEGKAQQPQNIHNRSTAQRIKPWDHPVIEDLDSLPAPAHHLLPIYLYSDLIKAIDPLKPLQTPVTTIQTTRGCPNRCTFCTNSSLSRPRYRVRSIELLRQEIKRLVSDYGIRELIFVDDNLTHSPRRTLAFCKMLCEFKGLSWWMQAGTEVSSLNPEVLKAMRTSGCYRLKFSMESGSPETLKRMNKKIDLSHALKMIHCAHDLGMVTQGQFLLGMPGDTMRNMQETYDWARQAGFNYTTFFPVIPFPGTILFKDLGNRTDCSLVPATNWELLNWEGQVRSKEFDREALMKLRKNYWQSLNHGSEEASRRADRYHDPAGA